MNITPAMRRRIVGFVVLGVIALGTWLINQWGEDSPPPGSQDRQSQQTDNQNDRDPAANQDPQRDPDSGLPWIDEAQLPTEAHETLDLIDAGGPYPYRNDDQTFGNREDILPDRESGYYREYTVETPGSSDRGARRIVTGADDEFYWTADHYQSFERIRR